MNPANPEFFPKPSAISFACQGGLDLLSPAVSTPPGTLQECWNYEVSITTGYTLASGLLLWGGKTFVVYREWIDCGYFEDRALDEFQIGGIYTIRSMVDTSRTARVRLLRKDSERISLQVIDGDFK